jgi:peptide-methionine (S)-S-oxide reductase
MPPKSYLLFIIFVSSLTLANHSEADSPKAEKATFAGGCFWCVEAVYQDLDGIHDVISGFTGGTLKNPTYNGNHSGHYEAVEVTYDPSLISYQQLLDIYWVNIDPFDDRGQFCDKGPSYRSAIFVASQEQSEAATASRQVVMEKHSGSTVYTEILDSTDFYPVEERHQDYYKKNPIRYKFYRTGCRRDARLHEIWGDAASH